MPVSRFFRGGFFKGIFGVKKNGISDVFSLRFRSILPLPWLEKEDFSASMQQHDLYG